MKRMNQNDFLCKIFFTDYSIQLPVPVQVDLIRFTPLPTFCYPDRVLSGLLFSPGFLIFEVAYIPIDAHSYSHISSGPFLGHGGGENHDQNQAPFPSSSQASQSVRA